MGYRRNRQGYNPDTTKAEESGLTKEVSYFSCWNIQRQNGENASKCPHFWASYRHISLCRIELNGPHIMIQNWTRVHADSPLSRLLNLAQNTQSLLPLQCAQPNQLIRSCA
jgi:hypothetical protein